MFGNWIDWIGIWGYISICPLSWTKDNTCLYSNSIYLKWLFSNNPKDRKLCARQIAVINVKKDVNVI